MYKIKVSNKHNFEIDRQGSELLADNKVFQTDIKQLNTNLFHIINNNLSYTAEVVMFNREQKIAEVKVNNHLYTVSAKDQFDLLLDKMGLSNLAAAKVTDIKAPMPGLVLKVFAQRNSEIKKGENLLVLEAMKMENIIKSPADLIIKAIKVKPGDKVEKGQILITV